jgi:2-oxoacid:acceptor oxidoreductase delta subunit (pyruvate/2-ketoisovalerate family)
MKHDLVLPFAITLGPATSRTDHTGSWRSERPEYLTRLSPCNGACPAGEDVRGWLFEAEEGGDGYRRAWEQLVETNPFPAVMGRVCYHPCETACNRAELDDAVGINSVERYLGDLALEQGWSLPPAGPSTGRRVLVVGAGPAGLSAAYHLRRRGHDVTVRESAPAAGGMMRFAIPAYRLPRAVLEAEIGRLLALGITLELDATVTDLERVRAEEGFDAVFLAVGAQLGRRTYIPAGGAAQMLDAVGMLHDLAEGELPHLGRRVAVYGGGNTAIDAARVARRLGADESLVVYRRTRERMPAHPVEVQEAEEEGVSFRWLSTIDRVDEGSLVVEEMELDADGFPRPTGRTETLSADTVVLALGQDTDLSLLEGLEGLAVDHGIVRVDDGFATGTAGVFAGGDVASDVRSVTVAIGHGRRAAARIDDWLAGRSTPAEAEPDLAAFESLNTWYYADAPRSHRDRLAAVRRQSTFDEVVHGLDGETALLEARRCLSCGSCFSCDNCYAVCPDNAIRKVDGPDGRGHYEIDLDYCKGCGLCVSECPAGAIRMVPEDG